MASWSWRTRSGTPSVRRGIRHAGGGHAPSLLRTVTKMHAMLPACGTGVTESGCDHHALTMVETTPMTPIPPTGFLRTGAKAALALMLLAGSADLATRLAFTMGSLQARADEAMRRAPHLNALEDQADASMAVHLPSHR